MTIRLVIGSRNASPWSLATWLAMRVFDMPFEDVLVPLDRPETEGLLQRFSPSGKLPVLLEGDVTVWESLAIMEYLAERRPEMWPDDAAHRALARSVATEVHGGFQALGTFLPMDMIARFSPPGRMLRTVAHDVKRIRRIWSDLRATVGKTGGGPFLFGRFTIADAMCAPLAARFVTYALPQDPVSAAYVEALMTLPAMREWVAEAASEVAAFDRLPAAPFHRTLAEPVLPSATASAPPVRRAPVPEPPPHRAPVVERPSAPLAAVRPIPAAASPRPLPETLAGPAPQSPAPSPPAVRPRLDQVDRPPISYLDEPAEVPARALVAPVPSRLSPALPAGPTVPVGKAKEPDPGEAPDAIDPDAPSRSRSSGLPGPAAPYPSGQPAQEKLSGPVVLRPSARPAVPSPPATDPDKMPEPMGRPLASQAQPTRPQPPVAPATDIVPPGGHVPVAPEPGGDSTQSPMFRLRRPGTALPDEPAHPPNRFVRAIVGHRERAVASDEPARPPLRRPGPSAPPPGEIKAVPPGPGGTPPSSEGRPVEPASAGPGVPAPPRSIRPSSIKPIGFSTHRRR